MFKRIQRVKTITQIPLSKADANNFDNLTLALAGLVYWNTSHAQHGSWSIDYAYTTEYICPDPQDSGMELVTTARYAIKLDCSDFLTGFYKLSEQHQLQINLYLDRFYRGNRPNGNYIGWVRLLLLDEDNLERINKIRAKQGIRPLQQKEIEAALQRVEVEDGRPEKVTKLSRKNTYTTQGEEPAFFLEPPDLLHRDYRLQYLAWRQLLYKVIHLCEIEVTTSKREVTSDPPEPEAKRKITLEVE